MTKKPENQSLVEQAFGRLRDDIVFGFFSAADKLNIESLKKRYDMGGTPIREALNRLVVVGLVEALPLKGFRVHLTSLEQAQDILQNRQWTEKVMLESALSAADDMWESLCVAALHRLKRCVQNEDFETQQGKQKWLQLEQQFLCQLHSGCSSSWLTRHFNQLYLHSMQYEQQGLSQMEAPGEWIQARLALYGQLLDACLLRDLDLIEEQRQLLMTQLLVVLQQTEKG